jgi:hypothetical protein
VCLFVYVSVSMCVLESMMCVVYVCVMFCLLSIECCIVEVPLYTLGTVY